MFGDAGRRSIRPALFLCNNSSMSNHARNRGNVVTRVPVDIDLNTDEGRCKAFHQLAGECLGGAKTIAAGYPQSMTAHALELGLKAFLAKFGVSNETLQNTFGHNLLMLHEEACKRGLSISAANAKSAVRAAGFGRRLHGDCRLDPGVSSGCFLAQELQSCPPSLLLVEGWSAVLITAPPRLGTSRT